MDEIIKMKKLKVLEILATLINFNKIMGRSKIEKITVIILAKVSPYIAITICSAKL